MDEIIIEPYTYYRSRTGARGFLVADVHRFHRAPDSNKVILIEFGQPRNTPIEYNYNEFVDLVSKGDLIQFTPKVL